MLGILKSSLRLNWLCFYEGNRMQNKQSKVYRPLLLIQHGSGDEREVTHTMNLITYIQYVPRTVQLNIFEFLTIL